MEDVTQYDAEGNPVVDSPAEADQNASEKLNTVEANNEGDENTDGTQDDADENLDDVEDDDSTYVDPDATPPSDEITHPDVVGETPDVPGDTAKDVASRADYVELAKNQFNLTDEEAANLFDKTDGESFDEDLAQEIKDARKVNVLKSVRVPAGDSNPLNAAETEREEAEAAEVERLAEEAENREDNE